jgi:hypothetical protein
MDQAKIRNFCIIAHIDVLRHPFWVSQRAGQKARFLLGLLFPDGGRL